MNQFYNNLENILQNMMQEKMKVKMMKKLVIKAKIRTVIQLRINIYRKNHGFKNVDRLQMHNNRKIMMITIMTMTMITIKIE